MIGHIAERFVIHFFSAGTLIVAVSFALRYWLRRNAKVKRWVAPERERLLVVSCFIVSGIAAWREPFDVAAGGSVVKSVFDFISWYSGSAVSAWALYRWWKE
ncbi:MAG TPA: hypothetical protein GXZ49_10260 [Bacteroidetes bacterium]|nr:hypothetical protein [Bacillota bacterium]HHU35584.1 hypothetical protein [Bacteroidota bacterium]